MLLPDAGEAQAVAVAAGLRDPIGECQVPTTGQPISHLSASIGIAIIDDHTESDDHVLTQADRAMYLDKARMRADRVRAATG